jgi:predicted amidohydrolase YtcJ
VITLAIVNARVWTGNPRQPWASGIAVEGEKIIAVSSSAEVAKLVGESTRVIDAKGNFVQNPSGTIERGGPADFVIIGGDPSVPDVTAMPSAVIFRVLGGEVVL